MILIREATRDDLAALYDLYEQIGKKDQGYFEQSFDQNITILIASKDDQDCGFCLLNWAPRYSLYKRLGLPEIQDLNVVPDARRAGIATLLVDHCENLARAAEKDSIGISVGLTSDYGPAQIMYIRKGYVPDGFGVTYDREGVQPHRPYPIDDNLALMMIKPLV
jgi:ribosomal protein S18 acetylase RimI-like enzyme